MKVLIIGGGGREHAIAWKIARSPKVSHIYCAPGNAGIEEIAECADIDVMDFSGQITFAREKEIDLIVVGPDDPLVAGAVDALEEAGFRVFGPNKAAALLEGSKSFSKDVMKKYGIPTASYEVFDSPEAALAYLETAKMPIVLKADGLALGKGVLICNTREEAVNGVKTLMVDKQFGSAGKRIVAEEFMTGREVSVLSFVDGKTVKIMTSAQDHKRAKDGDQGLNTGGMGTFSPSPFYTEEVDEFCRKRIYQATVDAMKAEGREFKGIIFFGLMLTEDGPKVLEYNARFGDPETQVVLPRMKNDIVEVFEACIDGTLDRIDLQFEDNAAVCVVLASDGYPEQYEKGYPINGLETFKNKDGYFVFHAGSKSDGSGNVVTGGGRVLGVTAVGRDLKEARDKAYEAAAWVSFKNKYMRLDIGREIGERAGKE
ncbi:MAG: phosphoribosylamine--glycine ligase [Lacrimispora sp.]|uniref:phosphoribosylamine--glycine ligase n=1 Tax=Lacrimispora sp. TaxID=2719234 RepID=UPI0039E45339